VPKIHLTDQGVRSLKCDRRTTFWDAQLPAFGIRVGKKRKTFVAMVGRDRRRIQIGHYPTISLSDARTAAKRIILDETARPIRVKTLIFSEALEIFYKTHCAVKQRPSSQHETKRLLKRRFVREFAQRRIGDIEYEDVQDIIDGLLQTPSEALHAFRVIRTFFRWATKRRYIKHSPIEGMEPPSKERTRDRVLADGEVKIVWTASDFYPFGTIVRLLLLTGQRRSEIGSLRWEYIDWTKRTITLPQEVTKNGRTHTFPIGDTAFELLQSIFIAGHCGIEPARPPKTGYVFPSRDSSDRPFSGYSPSKAHLNKKAPIPPWTLHDLRRTMDTNLASIKTPLEVTEKLLNHVSGKLSGVAAIYNRYAYLDEMREALNRWESHLHKILA
jgi:integrase